MPDSDQLTLEFPHASIQAAGLQLKSSHVALGGQVCEGVGTGYGSDENRTRAGERPPVQEDPFVSHDMHLTGSGQLPKHSASAAS